MSTVLRFPRRRRATGLATRGALGPGAGVAFVLLGLLVLVAVFANVIAPHDPLAQSLADRLRPPVWGSGGSWDHILGTDQLGRDILSRLIYGTRVSLTLAIAAGTAAAVVGSAVGVLMAYVGGWVDRVLLRVIDIGLAFPFLVVAIAVVALLGASEVNLALMLMLRAAPQFARLARSAVLVEKPKDYVLAARTLGASGLRIAVRGILPNIWGQLLILWTFITGEVILLESGLSFLGFGIAPPTPTWGGMLSDGRAYIATAWWLITFPGIWLAAAVFSINRLGELLESKGRAP